MRRIMMKILNPFMKWLLCSPFHGLVSSSYVLIRVTGRKSGIVYATPVQYGQRGDTLYVVTSASYTWWKNLQGGAELTLHLRGKDYHAFGQTATDTATIAEYFSIIYPKVAAERFESFLTKSVAVRFELQPEGVTV
mgnify:CR=1 FL=1